MLLARHKVYRPRGSRRSFTLIELLIVATILVIMASTALFAMFGVMEEARAARTQAQIAKINELIMARVESYRSRKISMVVPPGLALRERSLLRLHVMRELMRMELPDRISDLTWSPTPDPVTGTMIPPPGIWRQHRRRAGLSRTFSGMPGESPQYSTNPASTSWTPLYEGSECLYLILASIRDGEDTALDYFKSSEIADLDEDGRFEILDAWGRPLEFLRWAPGFATTAGPDGGFGVFNNDDDGDGSVDDIGELGYHHTDDRSELQSRNPEESPDPLDPLQVDPRVFSGDTANPNPNPTDDTYGLFPLIASAGPDNLLDIQRLQVDANGNRFSYANAVTPTPGSWSYGPLRNDPYTLVNDSTLGVIQAGRPGPNAQDNITNHLIE